MHVLLETQRQDMLFRSDEKMLFCAGIKLEMSVDSFVNNRWRIVQPDSVCCNDIRPAIV